MQPGFARSPVFLVVRLTGRAHRELEALKVYDRWMR